MGQAIAVRGDFKAGEVRRACKAGAGCGSGASAAGNRCVLDGASRAVAAQGWVGRKEIR
jgi:hypothetical protein